MASNSPNPSPSTSSKSSSDRISQQTVLRIEPSWDNNNSAPALIKTKDFEHKHEPITITRTDETKTSTNKARLSMHMLIIEFSNAQQFNFSGLSTS